MINPSDPRIAVVTTRDPRIDPPVLVDAGLSVGAVSWGAILCGAAAAAALSLILLLLGVGLGLSSISPWTGVGASAEAIGVSTIVWISLTQLAAAALGGYLAGRLRTRWSGVPVDEVYFRDTAHGFMAWCVATLATATLLTSVIGSIVGGTAKATAELGAAAVTAVGVAGAAGIAAVADDDPDAAVTYYVDRLFRSAPPPPVQVDVSVTTVTLPLTRPPFVPTIDAEVASREATRILITGLAAGQVPQDDMEYLAQLVAQRTGLSAQDAQVRVNEVYQQAQNAIDEAKVKAKAVADDARQASAQVALWLFISLLIGAFFASWSATLGGRLRDA